MCGNILLLMPDFFDYPKMIIDELQSRCINVDYICNESDIYRAEYSRRKNFIYRNLIHFFPFMRIIATKRAEKAVTQWYNKQLSTIKDNYDYIICIKGDMFPEKHYSFLRHKYQKSTFILYQWDDLSLLVKTRHTKWFNQKLSYNIDDCKRKGFKYLPMFSQTYLTENDIAKKYDIAIIGTIDYAHEKRLRIIEKIYNKYKETFSFYLYLYRRDDIKTLLPTYNTKLSFEDYIKVLQSSKCIVDIALINQHGPTTRFNDALGTKTKVITTNKYIKSYPIFSDNILIIDENNPTVDKKFVTDPYCNNNLEFMSIKRWCNTILGITK